MKLSLDSKDPLRILQKLRRQKSESIPFSQKHISTKFREEKKKNAKGIVYPCSFQYLCDHMRAIVIGRTIKRMTSQLFSADFLGSVSSKYEVISVFPLPIR